MLLLRSVGKRSGARFPDKFPFDVPVIRALDTLEFTQPVTILVGDNGSGKSTLLEAIAAAARLPAAGSDHLERDPSLVAARELGDALKLVWSKRTGRGLFLRAEDFFGFARRMARLRQEFEQDLSNLDDEYAGRSDYARGLASMPYNREIYDMQRAYGESLDVYSHGESFLVFFQARFVPEGLYLLDEPEAPLSPLRQLALLALLKDMVAQGAQFILATHSPILMACPDAAILSFDDGAIRPAAYADLEHVRLMRDFLNDPDQFLRHL
jgi:predicted ATPase